MSGRVDLSRWNVLIIGVVFLALLSASCTSSRDTSDTVTVDADGGLSATPTQLGYTLSAEPNTFPSGSGLRIKPAAPLGSTGEGEFVAPPVSIESDEQPFKPVTVDVTPTAEADASRTLAVLWSSGSDLEILPIEAIPNGQLRALVPHFTNVGFLQFPSLAALDAWISGTVVDGLVNNIKDFFAAPYECPTPTFESNIVDSMGYPNSVSVQVDVNDKPGSSDTVELDFCSRSNFALSYDATGAGTGSGFLLPRSKFPLVLQP